MAKSTTEIDLSGFGLERIQHIGRGQYANAQLVKEKSTGQTYVAKCISLAALNDHDQDLAHQEVFLLQTLSHPYIVAYRDSFLVEGANTLVIVMEYCDSGDLRKAIKEKAKSGDHFPEEQVMTWFVQLCLALQYIHSEKVLHRDLKTSNIFLTGGGSEIKLGDFGISRVLEGTTEAAVTIVGTPYYMSPEVCRSEPYNWKSDVWALGCVLYELCMLKHAFESTSLLGLVYKIVSDHYEPIPSLYSSELNDLIHQLLTKSAESRPSINEVFSIPYVKAYLAKQAVPSPMPPSEEPPLLVTREHRRASLRPPERSPPPPVTPLAPGPPVLGEGAEIRIIAARIRRRLVGQKLNWISSCASFDGDGDGALKPEEMRNALTAMHLGLSQDEISALTDALKESNKISLDAFSDYIRTVPQEVQHCETWARQILAPAGKRLRELLRAKDSQQLGTLSPMVFQAALRELAPVVTEKQLDLLVVMADKNFLGDVDYAEFANTFGAPLAPPPSSLHGPPAPPGMPPLPSTPSPVPPGMPPLPTQALPTQVPPPAGPPQDLNATLGTLTMVDINLDRTFFTCASQQLYGAAAAGRVLLSPQGCLLVLSRLRRRLEAAQLPITDALLLFSNPGEREITGDQWLDVASALPLGVSRAEMQHLFSRVDTSGTGRLSVNAFEAAVAKATASDCATAPTFISAALSRGLCDQIRDELRKLGGVGGARLARESDFRRVVMQTERYLTSDQLNSLVLIADKNPSGHVDYEEFAERFSTTSPSFASDGVRVPGGVLPPQGSIVPGPTPSEEEIAIVCSRTSSVLERHGLPPERLPALLALWGGDLHLGQAAVLLAGLPIGMSRQETFAQLQAVGTVSAFAARLIEVRSQGTWRNNCDWAGANVPGPALRNVLQRQICEADSRTLEPAEFVRLLVEAGVAPNNAQHATWLAEKTPQGSIFVAEFLDNFGGPPPANKKKKRGIFSRIMGR